MSFRLVRYWHQNAKSIGTLVARENLASWLLGTWGLQVHFFQGNIDTGAASLQANLQKQTNG